MATRLLQSAARLVTGAVIYAFTRRTPVGAYQSMINLFCYTGGLSNACLASGARLFQRSYRLPEASGVLGHHPPAELKHIRQQLELRGYHVFEARLPADLCDRLLEFAMHRPCKVRAPAGQSGAGARQVSPVYNRAQPEGVRYDFDPELVLANPDVQELFADPSMLAVAQAYLRATPVADVLGMWWHTAFSDRPDEEAAQYFHFDMDRIKWLKFFIYLTDVTPDTGPHTFVAGSHRNAGIPWALRKKGYARLTDEEVAAHYAPEDFVEFSGPRGTVIAEDTRGLHKGKHVLRGDRLILQLQFSISLFGGFYPPARVQEIKSDRLASLARKYPRIYANYLH